MTQHENNECSDIMMVKIGSHRLQKWPQQAYFFMDGDNFGLGMHFLELHWLFYFAPLPFPFLGRERVRKFYLYS